MNITHIPGFTYKNLCKKHDNVLLEILLKLQEDLKYGCIDTLVKYAIKFKHIEILPVETELELEIMKLRCVSAACGIQMQCGHEYGFANGCKDACATELLKLTPQETSEAPSFGYFCQFVMSSGFIKKIQSLAFFLGGNNPGRIFQVGKLEWPSY